MNGVLSCNSRIIKAEFLEAHKSQRLAFEHCTYVEAAWAMLFESRRPAGGYVPRSCEQDDDFSTDNGKGQGDVEWASEYGGHGPAAAAAS